MIRYIKISVWGAFLLAALALSATPVSFASQSSSPIHNSGTIRSTNHGGTTPFIGLATRFTDGQHTTARYQAVANEMNSHRLNCIRIGCGGIFSSSYTWHNGDAIDWFLRNTNCTVIVDRHHTVGAGSNGGPSITSAQWTTIDNDLAEMAVRWASYGDRVILEPINEYGSSDFKTQMQRIITTFRNKGYSTWLVFNWILYSQYSKGTWQSQVVGLTDPLNKTYVGYHYYMNAPEVGENGQNAFNHLNNGHTLTGLPILCTEEGADTRETDYFTKAKVDALSKYLQLSANAGFGNVVWMLDGLTDMPTYDSLGLVWPTLPPSN